MFISKHLINKAFIACLLLIPLTVNAQDEKMKAIFVYNFTRYFDWSQKPGNFLILVLGKSPIYTELSEIALKKKVGTTAIEVRSVNALSEIGDCHIVYVTSSKTDQISSIVSANKNLLIVSEKEGACSKGAGINFINLNGKLSFEISRSGLEGSGLTVISSFYGLGTVVK
jgi:hypothetical protein